MKVLTLVVFPVCSYEGVLGVIKKVEYALVQRQSCAEDGCRYDLVVVCRDIGNAERCYERFFGIVQGLADFIGEYLTKSFKISAES